MLLLRVKQIALTQMVTVEFSKVMKKSTIAVTFNRLGKAEMIAKDGKDDDQETLL